MTSTPETLTPAPAAPASKTIRLTARAANDHRVRYAVIGLATNVVYFSIFWLGWHLLEGTVSYLAVTAAANLLTALSAYPVYRSFVFGSTTTWPRGFGKFYTVYLGGLAASLLGLPLLVEVIGLPVLLAQGLVIALVPIASYLVHRFWTFA